MANLTSNFKSLSLIGTAAKGFATLLLLAGLVLPYDISHLHTNLEQENDCLYCQVENSPAANPVTKGLLSPVLLDVDNLDTTLLKGFAGAPRKLHRQRAPPAVFSYS